jgi:uncharacterized protein
MTSLQSAPEIAAPVQQSERISILDSLRGFAILGILLMNIPGFAIPLQGHDPSLLNETGLNYYLWYIVVLVPHGTQRALFSMLFGAGIILFINSRENKPGRLAPIEYFFRRQLWLMAFSVFDVWVLLWPGDILLDYALLGLMMVPFRNLPPKKLLIGALVCISLMTVRNNLDLYNQKKLIARGEAVALIDTNTTKLDAIQKSDLAAMLSFKNEETREAKLERREKAIQVVSEGSYERLAERRTRAYTETLARYLYFELWDVLLFMFIGMAFFKMGILTGKAPVKVYALMCVIGMSLGFALMYNRLEHIIDSGYNDFIYAKLTSFELYEPGRLLRALGIFGFIMLLYKSGWFNWLFAIMRAPGQMAFTNYLAQSLICGILFYSVGFKLYGRLDRAEVYLTVLAIWIFQIIFSHIWLHYFRFGPFEWLWRSLTYWKRQPMMK